jgi:hypothetical protein
MSFRQPKSHRRLEERKWREWLSRNAAALKAINLRTELTLSPAHWIDFLQNGYLEWHPESNAGFVFDQLSADQMRGLLTVLDASPEFSAEPISGWLRHSLGSTAMNWRA